MCEIRPSCICVGFGGGALLTCLTARLGFDVQGLETDFLVVEDMRERKKRAGKFGKTLLHVLMQLWLIWILRCD